MFYSYSDDIRLLKHVSRPVPRSVLVEKYGSDIIRRFTDDGYIYVINLGYDIYRQESYGEPLLQITDKGIQYLHDLQADQRHHFYTFAALVISVVSLLLQLLDFIVK